MILADFECKGGHIVEHFINPDTKYKRCTVCGGRSKRIISQQGQYLGNMDAGWIKSVLDVVDRTSDKPHVREFVKNPNRETYRAWMKGEKIRPLDSGELKKVTPNYNELKHQRDKYILDRLTERRRIELP